MSLVDYASSDDEEAEFKDLKTLKGKPDIAKVHVPPPPSLQKLRKFSSTQQLSTLFSEPSVIRLPDASMLLNSLNSRSYPVSYNNHNRWVEASVARKRNASGFGSSSSSMHIKVSKTISDTIRGQLVPPQLKGK
ncbi:uncharacterized protein LOC124920021 [Impatiens glandulifera]|uniref:uncharacterized protein LOC124920021 n=1 Tax=Impatiens glandulifera TaxID=253017 RepID=UPI001FB100A0|nr:uncharacterized protein LOC124920021 [Impatiens glandulifera]